jgi:hypothetical protein
LDVRVYYSGNVINTIDMKKLFSWASGFISCNGEASSKRLVGVVCSAFLCGALVSDKSPSDALVWAVAGLAAAALGFTSYEKALKKEDK